MLKPALSDEKIHSGLEMMLDFFCEQIPRCRSYYSDEAFEQARWDLQRKPLYKKHFEKLQSVGYDTWTAQQFLFAGYEKLFRAEAEQNMQDRGYDGAISRVLYGVCWNYLTDKKILDRDHLRLDLNKVPFEGLPPDTKKEWCTQMFNQNEKYIKARYDIMRQDDTKSSLGNFFPPKYSPFERKNLSSGGK